MIFCPEFTQLEMRNSFDFIVQYQKLHTASQQTIRRVKKNIVYRLADISCLDSTFILAAYQTRRPVALPRYVVVDQQVLLHVVVSTTYHRANNYYRLQNVQYRPYSRTKN